MGDHGAGGRAFAKAGQETTQGDEIRLATVPTVITGDGEKPAFELFEPAVPTTPLVFCSPHSGRHYPRSLTDLSKLDARTIRRSEDLFVDELFGFAPEIGAPLIAANFPRAFLDVNREPYELDQAMFTGRLPDYANTGSLRVAGGLGTIPKIVAEDTEIYRARIDVEEGLERVEVFYRSFHEALGALIARTKAAFGMAILIDCHSMPSTVRALPSGRRPDVVIGDRYGTSAAARLVAMATSGFSGLGYDVMRNKPYAGGFITERYGKPSIGQHAIQIEISRSLYSDEAELRPHQGFATVRSELLQIFTQMAFDVEREYLRPLAAE